jgi:hypothetical protein
LNQDEKERNKLLVIQVKERKKQEKARKEAEKERNK